MKNKHKAYFTHDANQSQPMLNSLSTLPQHLWRHFRQFGCLYRSKHSHSVYQDMNELDNWLQIQIKRNSPSKWSEINVVFTFNISARWFTPASPIALSNRTTKGMQCFTKSTQQKTQTSRINRRASNGDSLTREIKLNQCRVHFQRFCNLRCAIYSNVIGCLFYRKQKRLCIKNRKWERKIFHSHKKLMWLNVLLTFNASAI